MLKLEQFREIRDNDPDRPNMLIQAYRVDSRRPGLPDGIPLRPIFVGIVQFTRDIYKGKRVTTEDGRFRLADGSQSFSLSHRVRTAYVVSRINQYR